VAAETKAVTFSNDDIQLSGNKGPEAAESSTACHADDAFAIEAGLAEGGLGHGVERVGDDDQIDSGDWQTTFATTSDMILKLCGAGRRGSMPGLRGIPRDDERCRSWRWRRSR